MSTGMMNVTVDDPSDRIDYQGGWDGTEHVGDPFVNRYSNSTFHASKTAGDSATFEWDGGCIWLFGAKRPNHGNFSISLDGADKQVFTSESGPSTDVFQQLLYTSGEIDKGSHSVVLVNEKGYQGIDPKYQWLDLDFLIYQGDEQASADANTGVFITTGTPQVPMALPTGNNPVISISSSATRATDVSVGVSAISSTVTLCAVLLGMTIFRHWFVLR